MELFAETLRWFGKDVLGKKRHIRRGPLLWCDLRQADVGCCDMCTWKLLSHFVGPDPRASCYISDLNILGNRDGRMDVIAQSLEPLIVNWRSRRPLAR